MLAVISSADMHDYTCMILPISPYNTALLLGSHTSRQLPYPY